MKKIFVRMFSIIQSPINVNQYAFSLIEILVVATIIGLLSVGGLVSYNRFNKSSRDTRRKTDLEQIRAALEMYRSNFSYYPTSTDLLVPTYIKALPVDPKTGDNYIFVKSPGTCTNIGGNNCTSYTMSFTLETNTCLDYEASPLGTSEVSNGVCS